MFPEYRILNIFWVGSVKFLNVAEELKFWDLSTLLNFLNIFVRICSDHLHSIISRHLLVQDDEPSTFVVSTGWHWSPGIDFKARLHNDINWLSFYLKCESSITSLPAEHFLPPSHKEVRRTSRCSHRMTHNFMFQTRRLRGTWKSPYCSSLNSSPGFDWTSLEVLTHTRTLKSQSTFRYRSYRSKTVRKEHAADLPTLIPLQLPVWVTSKLGISQVDTKARRH